MRFGRVGIHHQLSLPPVLRKVPDGHATPPVEHREGRLRWERSAKRHLAFSQACSLVHNVEPAVEVCSTRTSSPGVPCSADLRMPEPLAGLTVEEAIEFEVLDALPPF
jgi:hypothetical protein